MQNLFDVTLVEGVRQRIRRLRPESERQWGRMTVVQTLAHCTSGLEMAMGEIRPGRASFPASLVGLLMKPLVLRDDKPMRRNSPSAPELFRDDPARCELEGERLRLLAAIDSFASQGEACCTRHPHPFFGVLSPEQWGILMYKHVDHHLRQFGV